jgi:DNA repair protein RecO (recombination protein O)
MGALLQGDWARADLSQPRHQAECSGLVAAYVQWHLEHSIRSLRHVEHATNTVEHATSTVEHATSTVEDATSTVEQAAGAGRGE